MKVTFGSTVTHVMAQVSAPEQETGMTDESSLHPDMMQQDAMKDEESTEFVDGTCSAYNLDSAGDHTHDPDHLQPQTMSEHTPGQQGDIATLPESHQVPPTSRELLTQQAQEIIDDINSKRKKDTDIIADVRAAFQAHVDRSMEKFEQNMFQLYEHNGKEMQEKLQELYATLDRITQLEGELQQFRSALGMLYQDVTSTD